MTIIKKSPMNYEEFNKLVNLIKIGKHLPRAIYIHKDILNEIPEELLNYINITCGTLSIKHDKWNLIKLFKKDYKFSLLNYPDFFSDSYPSLESSYSIDLEKLKVRKTSYKDSLNPPILHRKELFLNKEHSMFSEFQKLTQEGEDAGLYNNPKIIGLKNNWERLIRRNGYILKDGHIIPLEICSSVSKSIVSEIDDIEIQRHKTAISRDKLSLPMQTLANRGFLNGEYSIFDYGCGKGGDLNELLNNNIEAYGWDPVFKLETELIASDIVNLGYVINVIENQDERKDTLIKAYQLANKLLVVSAMIGNENVLTKFTPYKDGVVTKNNTFQKYFSQAELSNYVERTLNTSCIPVAPGIIFIFKDELEEQLFLLNRQKSKNTWRNYKYTNNSNNHDIEYDKIIDKNEPLFEEFRDVLADLGRIPGNDEFEHIQQIRNTAGSFKKALNTIINFYGDEFFNEAKNRRKDDLLVYFALSFFRKRKPYSRMPESLKRDIKAFFEKYTDARVQGKKLLFSLASPKVIYDVCVKAHEKLPASQLNDYHDLIFHRQFLNQCPKELRVYIGCAIQLYGDIDNVDLIKAHIRSGKVSFMIYDDWEKDIPLLKERIKIKLREQDIDFFDYVDEYLPQPLINKSIFTTNL
jgi:DNA phosphorothioation-associated putative methyltransferase